MIFSSYKDCPPFDLDKLLEDVQNGLHPITAYHLLFPTHSTLNLPTKTSSGEKILTTSSSISSLQTSNFVNTDNDLITAAISQTDSSMGYSINGHDPNLTALTNGIKSRTGTATFERSISGINDTEHANNDLNSTAMNNNSSTTLLSNSDEKENRRIIDIQCKLKTKDSRSCLVRKKTFFVLFAIYVHVLLFSYLLV